ncbi:hypothetical protein D0T53_11005 [Dysgonomonas sp. 216]|uniref:hypothetical protein n=1 Tax=Dysgonomonas sp. 216 TaxID=2302934 RepID=UPI0013D15FF8|nr:hypothetical protein [Dysgonomonas sp. 216]NDW19433.1 hypothetical protein [Dysgonomonas sp. 216]
MNLFEQILLSYGGYVLLCVRNVFEINELYEECAEINKVFDQYQIDKNMTVEDWISEFWKQGYSGQTALHNAPYYFIEAMNKCKDKGLLNSLIEI